MVPGTRGDASRGWRWKCRQTTLPKGTLRTTPGLESSDWENGAADRSSWKPLGPETILFRRAEKEPMKQLTEKENCRKAGPPGRWAGCLCDMAESCKTDSTPAPDTASASAREKVLEGNLDLRSSLATIGTCMVAQRTCEHRHADTQLQLQGEE